jgi:carboxyl-terminal processing protease
MDCKRNTNEQKFTKYTNKLLSDDPIFMTRGSMEKELKEMQSKDYLRMISEAQWNAIYQKHRMLPINTFTPFLNRYTVWKMPKKLIYDIFDENKLNAFDGDVISAAAVRGIITWEKVAEEYTNMDEKFMENNCNQQKYLNMICKNKSIKIPVRFLLKHADEMNMPDAITHLDTGKNKVITKEDAKALADAFFKKKHTSYDAVRFSAILSRNHDLNTIYTWDELQQLQHHFEQIVMELYRGDQEPLSTIHARQCQEFWKKYSGACYDRRFKGFVRDDAFTDRLLDKYKDRPDIIDCMLFSDGSQNSGNRAYALSWPEISIRLFRLLVRNFKWCKFIADHCAEIDWDLLSMSLDFHSGSRREAGYILDTYPDKVNWDVLDYQSMRIGLIRRHSEYVNWYCVKESGAVFDANLLSEHNDDIEIGRERIEALKKADFTSRIYRVIPRCIRNSTQYKECHPVNVQRNAVPTIRKENKKAETKFSAGQKAALFFFGAVTVGACIGMFNIKMSAPASTIHTTAITDSSSYKDAVDNIKQYTDIIKKYGVYDVNEKDVKAGMIEGAINGYSKVDPFAEYISPEQEAATDKDANNRSQSYTGIGIIIAMNDDGTLTVQQVFSGSGAEDAGIKENDIITRIDGVVLTKENALEQVAGITSEEDKNSVVITVRNADGTEKDVTVMKKEVTAPKVTHQVQQEKENENGVVQNGIGYIAVSDFTGNVVDQFKAAVDTITEQHAKGLVIDLRNNFGGEVDKASEMLDYLLPDTNEKYNKNGKALFASIETKNEDTQYWTAKDGHSIDEGIPIEVLVNDNTASAAELMAGVLQEYGRAEIVGERTYGKGTVQSVFSFDDGGSLKFTSGKWFLPDGKNIQGIGITPDVNADQDNLGIRHEKEKAYERLNEKLKNPS